MSTTPEAATHGRIAPLFWHKGDEPEAILRELEAVRSSGIREIVLEPRPHPDYLGEGWWRDLGIVLDAAREHDMRVWLFDDAHFPSGSANGTIREQHPELRKRHLGIARIDVVGPMPGATFELRQHLPPGIELLGVAAAPRIEHDGVDRLDDVGILDLSDAVSDDVAYWDVPQGRWRVVVLTTGHDGGEAHTVDYLDPIADRAAETFLSIVHEPHFARFGDDFGGVIAGFFQDEPRFGNAATYRFLLGRERPSDSWEVRTDVLPWSEPLRRDLEARWGEALITRLPLLWQAGGDAATAAARYDYMDAVTRRYETFQRTMGDWCAERGVEFIGHVVEDDGAHARLGYGAGHFFRAMAGQHMGGIDVVQHVRPEADGGTRVGTFGVYDDRFTHWGLAKLAASAAHIDPRKQGRAMCEAFGAYGWHEGLRLMKQITDHLVVRGVTVLVPHAFSARVWDPDCPPHFHNGGLNPQWPHFAVWRDYAERLCARIGEGRHLADAAVLYHAEAEWAGEAMPFERAVEALGRRQRDADVVPVDALADAEPTGPGGFRLGDAAYPVLVVPWAERQPAALAEHVLRHRIRTIVVDALPVGWADRDDPELLRRFAEAVEVAPLDALPDLVPARVHAVAAAPDLRVVSVERPDGVVTLLLNESRDARLDAVLEVPDAPGHPIQEDPAIGRSDGVEVHERAGGRLRLAVRLEPGETRLVRFGADELPARREEHVSAVLPGDGWRVELRRFDEPEFSPAPFDSLGAVNAPGRLRRFAGAVRCTREVDLTGVAAVDLGAVGETATVSIDGRDCGTRIAPPYRFEVPTGTARAQLRIEVATTLGPAAADNMFDSVVALEPSGLLGPVSLIVEGP